MSGKETNEQRLEKIKKILSDSNGEINEELKREVESFVSDKKKGKIKNLLVGGVCSDQEGLTETDTSQPKGCNDPTSDLLTPPLPEPIKLLVKETVTSLLNPIKTTFITEVSKYSDAISIEEKKEKKIKRAIPANSIKKLENGIFSSPASETGYVVNPEFKQLLATGYRPKADSYEYQRRLNNGTLPDLGLQYGTPESDYIKNIENMDITGLSTKEEVITGTLNNVGGAIIKPYEEIVNNVSFNSTAKFQEIRLNGYSTEDLEAKKLKYNPSISREPNWTISYKEAGTNYSLKIDNNFEYFTNNKITKDTSSYYFSGEIGNSFLSQEALDTLNDLSSEECNIKDNKELFTALMNNNDNKNIFDLIIDNRQVQQSDFTIQLNNDLNAFINSSYSNLLSNFVTSFFSSYKNNRLLKHFKQKIPGLTEEQIPSNLKIINLLNFIPQPSEELLECGKQPHPLNLDLVVDLMVKKFEEASSNTSSTEEICNLFKDTLKKPITQASEVATSLMFVRLCIFENLLKALFVLDEHEYSFDLLDSEILLDFILIKVVEEFKKYNIFEEMEDIIEENYSFFKENLNITDEDENRESNKINKIVVNKISFDIPSEQIIFLIKHLTRRNFGFLKNLIGVQNQQSEMGSILEKVIYKNKIIDINSARVDINRSSFERDLPTSGAFFTIEKFIDFGDYNLNGVLTTGNVSSNIWSNIKYYSTVGCTNIKDYQEFLRLFLNKDNNTFSANNTLNKDIDKLNYYLRPPMLSIRLMQNYHKKDKNGLGYNDSQNQVDTDIKSFFMNNKEYTIKAPIFKLKKIGGFRNFDIASNVTRYYNSLLISEVKIPLTFEQITRPSSLDSSRLEVVDLEEYFETRKQELLNMLANDSTVQLIMKKCFFLDKLPNLALFYTHSALSNSTMNNMFNTSKKRILDLHKAAMNVDNYSYKNETELKGGIAKKFQDDFQNIGDPTGGSNPDILQFLITTPILILKGLAQVMDPNIAIASQIVNAAAAGLLFPKADTAGNLSYPGEKVILPTALASLALLPVNIFAPLIGPAAIGPPVTPLPGMLYWALEPLLWKLPFYQNQAANSDEAKKLKDDPSNKGLKIGDPSNFSCDRDQDE